MSVGGARCVLHRAIPRLPGVPYRQTQPICSWTLATSSGWKLVLPLGVLLAVGGPAWLWMSSGPHFWLEGYALTALPGLGVVAVALLGGDGYRVHGGQAEMRLFPDRLEVPRTRAPGFDVLPLATLRLRWTRFKGYVNFVPVTETLVLHLESGGVSRAISQRLVGGQPALEQIALEIGDAMRNASPEGGIPDEMYQLFDELFRKYGASRTRTAPAAGDRDELDDRIDTELSKMDD